MHSKFILWIKIEKSWVEIVTKNITTLIKIEDVDIKKSNAINSVLKQIIWYQNLSRNTADNSSESSIWKCIISRK